MKIVVLSDIHGNYDALSAVLGRIRDYDYLLVLGDLVDYGPEPERVIDALKSDALIVKGNHDHAVAFGVDCGCSEETHDVSVFTREKITLPRLDKNQISFLSSLPSEMNLRAGDHSLKLVHGSPNNPLYGYVYPWNMKEALCPGSSRVRLLQEKIEKRCDLSWDFLLLGHTHHQFTSRLSSTLVMNPGSVGQPRDGDPRAAFALIEIDGDELRVSHHRVKYDAEAVVRKIKELIEDKEVFEKLAKILISGRVF